MSVTARFKVTDIQEQGQNSKQISLQPVSTQEPTNPNYKWSQATPSGSLQMTITNPEAYNQFQMGETYDLEFKKAKTTA